MSSHYIDHLPHEKIRLSSHVKLWSGLYRMRPFYLRFSRVYRASSEVSVPEPKRLNHLKHLGKWFVVGKSCLPLPLKEKDFYCPLKGLRIGASIFENSWHLNCSSQSWARLALSVARLAVAIP